VLEIMDAKIGLTGIVHTRMAGMNLIAARNALKQAFAQIRQIRLRFLNARQQERSAKKLRPSLPV
jgi:hypothetical protein